MFLVIADTSKSAVLQLARNLAAEWGNDGEHPPIRVNTISPGLHSDTDDYTDI